MVGHRLCQESPWGARSCEDLLSELPPFILKVESMVVVDHLLVLCLLGTAFWQQAGSSEEKKILCALWPTQTQEMGRCVEIKLINDILRWW